MSKTTPQFYYPKVLEAKAPAIYRKGSDLAPDLDKPEGFRIPLIYFSWGILEDSRSLHHHPDNDEMLIVLSGEATVQLYGPGKVGERFDQTYEVSAGDVVLFPQGWTHSVEDKATGEDDRLRVMVIFNNQEFLSVETSEEFQLPNDPDAYQLGENR